jgi:hypothetical protein
MRRYFWVMLAAFILSSAEARADYVTGGNLLELCDANDLTKHMYCMGFIEGVSSLIAAGAKTPAKICMPQSTMTAELVGSTIEYLKAHPEARDYSAAVSLLAVLEKSFPCR